MRNFLLLLVLLFLQTVLSAGETGQCVRENFYYLSHLQAVEIMRETWKKWQGSRYLTAKDRYWGARLAYRCNQRERALCYFRQAALSGSGNWVEESSRAWQTVISGKPLTCNARTSRGLSEMAVALRETGNDHAWLYACSALIRAAQNDEPLQRYWENLAITQPCNSRLWGMALKMAFNAKRSTPFFDPELFRSLFAFWEKIPGKSPRQWPAYEPLGDDPVFSLTPNSVLHRENFFCTVEIREKLCARQGGPLYLYLHRYRAVLWGLAWLYAHEGIENFRWGNAAHRHLRAALAMYDMLFWPGRRGNLLHFDLTGVMQMSCLWMAMHRYEEMLTYIYTPDSAPVLKSASSLLRPALQFLLAAEVTGKNPVTPVETDFSKDFFALIWCEGAFSGENDPDKIP